MSKLKSTLLYSLLLSALAVMPFSAFAMGNGNGNDHVDKDKKAPPKVEQPADEKAPHTEKTASRFRFGVYYGRPNYYRPYYYYYPYRPYYYRYNYYNRPYYYW